MPSQILPLITTLALLAAPASASAAFTHVVAPGESLSSVAAADGLSVSQLAAVNGIAPDTQLVAGSTIQIPPQPGDVVTATGTTASAGAEASPAASQTSASAPRGSASTGSYLVQGGDTLSAVALASGTTIAQLAAANGLEPAAPLLAGTTLSLPGGSSSSASTPPVSSATPVAGNSPQPTPETVSPADIGSVAAANGVSPSLAEAIGYQESGFNNGLVSRTGAIGVMQIEPGTWSYIAQNLATPPPLSSASAQDNIRGGVLLLRSLLDQTGGDPGLAAAGYYQGLDSVRKNGIYADTQRYVADVLSLRQRFGGP